MLKKLILATATVLMAANSYASVVILGTRVIYPSDQKSVNIQLNNTSTSPSLVQAWVDDGDENATPNKTKAPFVVSPPMTRVEGKAGQTLRLMYTGKDLPQDRESLFYFNLLDVPPKPKAEDIGENKNYLQFAVRNRLKLFYRPAKLSMPIGQAYQNVEWKLIGGDQVQISNQSPYHITYNVVRVNNQVSDSVSMIAPFSNKTVKIPTAKRGNKVKWSVITDFGGLFDGESTLK